MRVRSHRVDAKSILLRPESVSTHASRTSYTTLLKRVPAHLSLSYSPEAPERVGPVGAIKQMRSTYPHGRHTLTIPKATCALLLSQNRRPYLALTSRRKNRRLIRV